MSRIASFQPEFVTTIPDLLEEGRLYISMPFATAIHLCACGCRFEVVTPLRRGRWRLLFDGEVTLRRSIGNQSFPCKSHYFITRNRVVWLPVWRIVDLAPRRRTPIVSNLQGRLDHGGRMLRRWVTRIGRLLRGDRNPR
jgi:uncharacterized protein DUF6527